jgi:uncharacterized protein YerC
MSKNPTVEYVKPAEPQWSVADDLRHLLTLLRAATMQAGTLHKRAKGNVAYRIGLLAEALGNHENTLTSALVTLQNRGQAEQYFDNEGALLWEACNEIRKLPERRNGLAVLLALNAGQVINHDTGQSVRDEPFTERPE